MLYSALCVGLGGFIGAILRMFAITYINKIYPCALNLGTLFVNIIGSFIIGIIFSYIHHKVDSALLRNLVSTGILGAFTTFSTFSYDNLLLLQKGMFISLFANIVLNVLLCLIATYLGYLVYK